MILSHKYQFIFIKTEKTAGTSFEIALSKFCGPEDIITPIAREDEDLRRSLGFRQAQNYHKTIGDFIKQPNIDKAEDFLDIFYRGRRPRKFWNHIPAADLRDLISPEVWRSYTKFTIVRDPVDQTISNYNWVKNRYAGNDNLDDLSTYVRTRPSRLRNNWDIVSYRGDFLLDYAIRFEKLSIDADEVGAMVGLPENLSGILSTVRAKSGYSQEGKEKQKIATDDDIKVIRYLRKEEADFFGY